MDGLCKRPRRAAIGLAIALCGAGLALADLADVHLKSGLRLRGDVTTTDDEVIVRNSAGEVRLPRADVIRIVPVETPVSQPATQAAESAPSGETRTPTRKREAPAEGQPSEGRGEQLLPAPAVSKADIQRLRLREMMLNEPAEKVRVQFEKKGRQRDLPTEVLEELRKRVDFRPPWEDVLTRGQPYEKLQLILRLTGIKYADRIVIDSDPEVFAVFRKRVLPLVDQNCGRSGCHAGTAARVFRFPIGSRTSDSYAYTTFVLLDQMQSRDGPVIDRSQPDYSVLLHYLLPQEATNRGHPPVGRGPSFKAGIRGQDDPQYAMIADWIGSLVVPRPDYGLEYKNPYTGSPPEEPAAPGSKGSPSASEGQGGAGKMPTSETKPAAEDRVE